MNETTYILLLGDEILTTGTLYYIENWISDEVVDGDFIEDDIDDLQIARICKDCNISLDKSVEVSIEIG